MLLWFGLQLALLISQPHGNKHSTLCITAGEQQQDQAAARSTWETLCKEQLHPQVRCYSSKYKRCGKRIWFLFFFSFYIWHTRKESTYLSRASHHLRSLTELWSELQDNVQLQSQATPSAALRCSARGLDVIYRSGGCLSSLRPVCVPASAVVGSSSTARWIGQRQQL